MGHGEKYEFYQVQWEALLFLLLLGRGATWYNLSGSWVKNGVGRWPRVEAEKVVGAQFFITLDQVKDDEGDGGGDCGALD